MAQYSDFVSDDYGRPIPNTSLALYAKDGTTHIASTTSGIDGGFTFTAPDGQYVLVASYGGQSERTPIIIGSPPEFIGPPGPAGNVAATLAQLKAALTTNTIMLYDGATFTWTLGSYVGKADNVNVVQSNLTGLNVGAWVRQSTKGITFSTSEAASSVVRSLQEKLREEPLGILDYYNPAVGNDYRPALQSAIDEYAADRINPPHRPPNNGTGVVYLPRGVFALGGEVIMSSVQGAGIIGQGQHVSVLTRNFSNTASGIYMDSYDGVRYTDFSLINLSPTPGSSFGCFLNPVGGGGTVKFARMDIRGFGTGIRIAYVSDGDKTIYEQVTLVNTVGWDNGQDKQAISHVFNSPNGGCSETFWRYGGSGEVIASGGTINVFGSLVQVPEGGGNPISGNFSINDTKLEYHGTGDRLLIDARNSVLNQQAGGSSVVFRLRGLTFASGPTEPGGNNHTVIKVGDGTGGSDDIIVQADGGDMHGRIEIASAITAPLPRRWYFRDQRAAPDPAQVQLQGVGNHALIEYRANQNVPVDQYRGGQAFNGSIDAEKAYLWHQAGAVAINTNISTTDYGDSQYGSNFVLGGFPPGMTITAIEMNIMDHGGSGTGCIWYADSGFTTPIGSRLLATTDLGLQAIVHDPTKRFVVGSDGNVFLRLYKKALNQVTIGDVVVLYFPRVL